MLGWRHSRRGLKAIRLALTHAVLLAGALLVLFPLAWMLSASLKPEWQVFARPIIWIPQRWYQQQAGQTGRLFGVMYAPQGRGWVQVVQIGATRYVAVVNVESLSNVYSILETEVSDPSPREIEGVAVGARWANIGGERHQVVALARQGDHLIMCEMKDLHDLAWVPQPLLQQATKTAVVLGGLSLQASVVASGGIDRTVMPVGGGQTFATVVPVQALAGARLVHSEYLRPLGVTTVGERQAQIKVYELAQGGEKAQVVCLADQQCTPVVGLDVIKQAFAVAPQDLVGVPELRSFGNVEFEMQTVTGSGQEVAVLQRAADRVLVIAPEHLQDTGTISADEAADLHQSMVSGVGLLVKDNFEGGDGRIRQVALVGQSRQMAIVIPVAEVGGAFDVPEGLLRRASTPSFRWRNYVEALSTKVGDASFLTFYRNTITIVALNIIGSLLSCTIVAYGFSRLRAPGKTVLFTILLATMMLPFPVTMIPLYETFVRLGELTQRLGLPKIGQDTLWPLIIPSFFGNAFLIFLLRQFFMTIPFELEEAARIDGASRPQLLLRVLVPLLKPALATVVIFTFMDVWNDFMGPLIYLDSPRNFTVTLGLRSFMGQYRADYHLLMAASVVAMLPMVALFFLTQRFFIEGITFTGIKG